MTKRLRDIFKITKGSKLVFSALVLAMLCLSSLPAFTQDRAQLGKDCDAGSLNDQPELKTDANCQTPDCETRAGCLDAAPASPITRLSSDFGPRPDPLGTRYSGQKGHGAIDFAAPKGAPIYAAADGKISRSDTSNPDGYGNRIQIVHDNGYETLYAHMNCFASYDGKRLKVGQRIKKGTVIGYVGNTGSSTGPHLHYEVRVAGTTNKKDPHAPEMQGAMCKVPDNFVKADVPSNGLNSTGGTSVSSEGGNTGGGCSSSGCAKMYPADNISELHHKYEAGGDPCAFNKCLSGDIGGCSYGSSQLECNHGSMKAFLTSLIKTNPSIWNQLGGGTVDQMNARACAAPATDFSTKWKGLCTNQKDAINKAQEEYMKKTYYDTAAATMLKDYGLDFNKMSAELQMSLFSAAVAMGSPGGVRKLMNSVINNVGDPKTMTEEQLLAAMYARRDYFYSNSSEAVRKAVQSRNAREGAEAAESMKIRKAWEAEQANPSNPPKTYEQIVQEITGKTPCANGKSGTFSCTASGVSGESSGNAKGYENKTCSPSEYKSTYGSCLFCPLFQVVFNTASKIAKLSFNKLATPVLMVVMIAWAIWIAMQILTFISSLETKDAPTLIKTLLNKTFVVLIVVFILKADSSTFFSLAMEPIFNTGFRLAQMAVTEGACPSTYNILPDGGLPASMGTSILCTIEAIQGKLMATMALGAASICIAFYVKATLFIFPSLPYLITGLLIWCGAGIVIIIFPFLMLDAVFQLTVACALLPAAIGCYPFKTTQKYVGHVWNSFMNAMFNFVFLSIIILILTRAIEITVTGSGVNDLTDENFQEAIVTTMAWGGVAVIKIVFVLLLAWVTLDEAANFAGQFAGSLTKGGIGRNIGGMAAMGTKKLGLKAWGGAKTVGSAVGENIKEKVGDFRRDLQAKRIQSNGKMTEIKDDNGNVIGHTYEIKGKSWARRRDKTQTVTVMNNGTKMITTSKTYSDGRTVTTKSDGYLKQTEVKDKAGNVTKTEVSIQTAGLKAIRNKDGTMNMTALNAALKNSAFSEETIKAAALQQYAQQSFPGLATKFDFNPENIKMTKDEQGREVIEIVNKNEKDGSSRALRLTMPQEGSNARAIVELENTDENGKKTSHATDGMINRLRATRRNPKTGEDEVVEHYGVSEYYAKQMKHPVNHRGEFAEILERNGGTAFSLEDKEKMRQQFIRNRTEDRQNKISGIL